jgi:hypothetical protein
LTGRGQDGNSLDLPVSPARDTHMCVENTAPARDGAESGNEGTRAMKRRIVLAALALLAGCGEQPRVILTSAKPHSIQFFVQGARFVPLREVEDRAASHCGIVGLVARRTHAEWINDQSMTFRFDCEDRHRPPAEKLADRKPIEPPVRPSKADGAVSLGDPKQAAWNRANAMSPGWVKCISDGAVRTARATDDPADVAAVAVAAGCSRWEQGVHKVLWGAGEDDGDFEATLHRQIIEFAAARILSVRAAPVQEPAAATQHTSKADPRQNPTYVAVHPPE